MRAQPEEAPFTEEEEAAFVHPCTGERTETSVESSRKQGHAFVGEIEYRVLPEASKPKSTRPPPQSVTPPPCNSSHDNAKSNGGEEESFRRPRHELREAQRDEGEIKDGELKEAAKSSGGEQKSDSRKARRNEKGSKGEASNRGKGGEKEDEKDAEGDGKKSERKSIRTRTPRTSEQEKMQDESEGDERKSDRKSECMQARKARRSESGEVVVAISKGGKEEVLEDECGEDGEKDSLAGGVSLEALEKAREKVESVLKARERKGEREDDGVEREFEELVRKYDKTPT
jgi:hypothetical protein